MSDQSQYNFDEGRKAIISDNLLKSYGIDQSIEKSKDEKGLDSILVKFAKEYNQWCGEGKDCSAEDWYGTEASVLEFLQNNHEDHIDTLKDLIQEIKIKKNDLEKSNEDTLEKGGKRAVIGEKREFSGRMYIKTNDGWKFFGKGKGVKAQGHHESSNGKQSTAQAAGISQQEFDKLHPGTKKELENNAKKEETKVEFTKVDKVLPSETKQVDFSEDKSQKMQVVDKTIKQDKADLQKKLKSLQSVPLLRQDQEVIKKLKADIALLERNSDKEVKVDEKENLKISKIEDYDDTKVFEAIEANEFKSESLKANLQQLKRIVEIIKTSNSNRNQNWHVGGDFNVRIKGTSFDKETTSPFKDNKMDGDINVSFRKKEKKLTAIVSLPYNNGMFSHNQEIDLSGTGTFVNFLKNNPTITNQLQDNMYKAVKDAAEMSRSTDSRSARYGRDLLRTMGATTSTPSSLKVEE